MAVAGSADHYRQLAARIRARSRHVADPEARAIFEEIAAEYDGMAERLESAAIPYDAKGSG